MESRGSKWAVVSGTGIAIPSGIAVAVGTCSMWCLVPHWWTNIYFVHFWGGQISSLVGVAISASILPPIANAGMFIALGIFQATSLVDGSYADSFEVYLTSFGGGEGFFYPLSFIQLKWFSPLPLVFTVGSIFIGAVWSERVIYLYNCYNHFLAKGYTPYQKMYISFPFCCVVLDCVVVVVLIFSPKPVKPTPADKAEKELEGRRWYRLFSFFFSFSFFPPFSSLP